MLLTKASTTNQILQTSQSQWSTFFKGSNRWFGNFVLEDGSIDDYKRKTQLALAILRKSVHVVQQVRSYHTNLVQKEDIWDTKHMTRNETFKFVLLRNMETTSMEELRNAVKADIKSWIDEVQP